MFWALKPKVLTTEVMIPNAGHGPPSVALAPLRSRVAAPAVRSDIPRRTLPALAAEEKPKKGKKKKGRSDASSQGVEAV